MIVNWLEDGLAIVQALKMKLKNIEVVTIGMQCRNVQRLALAPIVLVVVVGTDMGDAIGP